METFNRLLDWIYFDLLMPVFNIVAQTLYFILLKPLIFINTPIWMQICLIAVLTVVFAFWLRKVLKTEEKTKKFQKIFTEKRMPQEDFKLVENQHQRRAMYKSSDDDLNSMYNTFLAEHYARYVLIYLLPLFLIMAWLNNIYSKEVLLIQTGHPFVINISDNDYDVKGLSVTLIFLVTYIISLIIGFTIRYYRRRKNAATDKKDRNNFCNGDT